MGRNRWKALELALQVACLALAVYILVLMLWQMMAP
jgi:hypothetical protein